MSVTRVWRTSLRRQWSKYALFRSLTKLITHSRIYWKIIRAILRGLPIEKWAMNFLVVRSWSEWAKFLFSLAAPHAPVLVCIGRWRIVCARLTWHLRQFKLCRTKVPGAFPFQAWYFDCIIVFNCPLLNTLLVSHARVTGKPYFQPNHAILAPSDCLIIFSSFWGQACCDVIVLINPRPIRHGPLVLSYEPIWCGKAVTAFAASNCFVTKAQRALPN